MKRFFVWTLAPILIFQAAMLNWDVVSAADSPTTVATAVATADPGAVPPDKEPQANPFRISPRSGSQHLDLSRDWQFGCRTESIKNYAQLSDIETWYAMKRPMTVQKALFHAGVIGDPYKGLNSKDAEWVEQRIWYFKKSFNTSDIAAIDRSGTGNAADKYVFLSFDGLDYYSRVWVNGVHLDRHEGMFSGPDFEISRLLRADKPNEIVVAVGSANFGNPNYSPHHFVKPWSTTGGSGVEPFFTLGFWRGARIDCVEKTHLERPYLTTRSANLNKAVLHFETEILSGVESTSLRLHKWTNHQLYDFSGGGSVRKPVGEYTIQLTMRGPNDQTIVRQFPVTVYEGRNWFKTDIEIDNPQLWNVNRTDSKQIDCKQINGKQTDDKQTDETQSIYNTEIQLVFNGKPTDAIAFPFGIRTIDWVETPGPQVFDRWTDWQVVVNGQKFFLKGCNWMPIDILFDLPPEKYDWYLRLARDMGVQILRIWGPGLQESEGFYDACDRYGILVWQDFSIGNADVSGWPLPVWESQVLGAIWRLRNRASLAVWCGGNEFNPYSLGNTAAIGTLERNLALFDPSRKFLRTSPDCGSYHCYPDMDPTWYKKRFQNLPYLAESGIHSVTSERSLKEYVNPDEFKYVDKMYLEEYRNLAPESVHHFVEYAAFRVPRMLTRASHFVSMSNMTLDNMALGTQLGAAEFYQAMADGVQANYPVTAGMMPWVFARSWPVISAIQLVDGTGQPVVPFYYLKNAYKPYHPAIDIDRLLWKSGESFRLNAKVLNVGTDPAAQGTVRVRVFDDSLKTVLDVSKPVSVAPGPSIAVVPFDAWPIPAEYKSRFFFAMVEFTGEPAGTSTPIRTRTVYWPRTIPQMEQPDFYNRFVAGPQNWPAMPPEGVRLTESLRRAPKAAITVTPVGQTDLSNDVYRITRYTVRVKNESDVPSPITWIELAAPQSSFFGSDNYFWLDGQEEKELTVTVRESANAPKSDAPILIRSLNESK